MLEPFSRASPEFWVRTRCDWISVAGGVVPQCSVLSAQCDMHEHRRETVVAHGQLRERGQAFAEIDVLFVGQPTNRHFVELIPHGVDIAGHRWSGHR